MSKRPSLMYEVGKRLDGLEAFGTSRHAAKAEQRDALRAEGKPITWAHSTGRIHSRCTKDVYRPYCYKMATWARETHGIRTLKDLLARSDDLASQWLEAQKARGLAPDSLHVMRSALRMFFGDRRLAAGVKIPVRHREEITRSRSAVKMDRQFQPNNWKPLIDFLSATGLRRREVSMLTADKVMTGFDGQLYIHIENGKGGRARTVPVLPGHEAAIQAVLAGKAPTERIFPRIPDRLDVHSLRRAYAQAYYTHLSGRKPPPQHGRLRPRDYDRKAAAIVSRALGHNRIDVITRNYLR